MRSTFLSKITAPALPTAVLHRTSLVDRLHDIVATERFSPKGTFAHYKLILLCAPVGYGKTTLLADFAQHTAIPCCWYFLDQSDTDRFTFLSTLLASLRTRFPGFGATLDHLLSDEMATPSYEDDSHRVEAFVDALLTAIDTDITERFALMLCNYHEVDESPGITAVVNQLLQKLPSQCVLIIESRATPSIEFASLLAHRQAIGWGSNILHITAQEILELAHIQGVAPLSEAEAEQLAATFDGWIAGILLGTRLGDAALLHGSHRTGILQGLPCMRVERETLFAYLVDEIFKQQPVVYAFLKEAAILRHMVPTLCDALLDITDAAQHLEHLVRQGMFVSCRDDGPELVYTCHPVLRELLCDELRRQAPERFAFLHRRAARLLREAHEYDEAISHALAAEDDHGAVRLIMEAYEQMPAREYTETLLRWIEALPQTTAETYPQLLLIRASIYLLRGEYYQALPLLDNASAPAMYANPRTIVDQADLPRLQMEIMLLRSKALVQAGQYQESQLLCQQVLEATPIDEVAARAEAHARFGMCANLLGDITAAIEHLQKALQLWGRHTVQHQTADTHSVLAIGYNMLGNFALAEHHLACAINCCDQLHDEKGKMNNLIRMATHKQRQGVFAEAEALLTQILTTARSKSGFEREESYILVNLGSVYQDRGCYDQSLKTLEEGLGLARRLRDNYLVNCCLCYLAMTYLLMGDASTARLLLSETNLAPTQGDSVGYERAIHDLTYGNILLQQHLYDEAYPFLTALEASVQKAGLKRELLRAKLSISACQLARGKRAEALPYLDEIASILESQDYGQIVFTGLCRYAALYQLVKTLPELGHLRTLLHIETPVQKTKKAGSLAPATPAPHLPGAHLPGLRIQAFGEPTVFLDEQPITRWRMAHAMELFFFLLDSGRPMRKEQIITALWPQIDDQINQTFHSTIYYLRKALNDAYVVSRGGIYSLDLSSSDNKVQYDVALFKDQYVQAKQFLASENDEEAKVALLSMVQLYQGDYVQPFYSDWCTFRRDELRRIYLEARNSLAHIAWRQEEFDESAVHWQHMLAIDNCLEEAHYGLIKYYMRTGKRSLALRQYHRCVETLQQELAANPGAAIQSLHQRLIGSSEPIKKSEPIRKTKTYAP